MKNQNGFALLILILVIAIVGTVGYFTYKNIKPSQPPVQSTPTPNANIGNSNNTVNENDLCQIMWVNPALPQKGVVEPLFLKEAGSAKGAGYEGIVRRQVEDGDIISVDLVTNLLPDANSPYYLWAIAVDSNGIVCSQTNLGPLEKISNTGAWGAGPFTLPVKIVNDAQLFVITQKGFGANVSDKITNLSDLNIILEGAYEDNHK